jgi:hypothetical protein
MAAFSQLGLAVLTFRSRNDDWDRRTQTVPFCIYLSVRAQVMGWWAAFLDMLVICEERNCVAWSLVRPKRSRRFA